MVISIGKLLYSFNGLKEIFSLGIMTIYECTFENLIVLKFTLYACIKMYVNTIDLGNIASYCKNLSLIRNSLKTGFLL